MIADVNAVDARQADGGATVWLDAADWLARRAQHRDRLAALLGDYPARRLRNEKHPVIDFLFKYYSFSLGRLEQWSPGYGVALTGPEALAYLRQAEFGRVAQGDGVDAVALQRERFPAKRRETVRWILDLLRQTAARLPFFGCFGLHEWAMAYRADDLRHPVPLRLGADGTAAVVDRLPVLCTHYDAFRFFTPAARPLNRQALTANERAAHEQPGCLHANMDLYKWAYKLYPWLASDLLAACFELALAARTLDMRASPYDLAALGYAPIAIETPEGRRDYAAAQQALADAAEGLRARLIAALDGLLAWAGEDEAAGAPAER